MPLVQGWLLDCYPSKDGPGMTFWLKTLDGQAIKLKDSSWHAKIYASGAACFDKDYVSARVEKSGHIIHSIKYANKKADFFRAKKNRVLEIELEDASKIRKLAELLERAFQNPDYLQLYNVDLLPEQQYFYEKDLFPLGFVEANVKEGEVEGWTVLDSIARYDYETPYLKTLRLGVEVSDRVPRFDSKLRGIELSSPGDDEEEEIAAIEGKSEAGILSDAMVEIEKFDPDLIITKNGDAFVLPFLYSKAARFSIQSIAKFNRDSFRSEKSELKTGGKTYFSYGRILYRPTTHRLFGRLHLDEQNTFIYDQCMLQGLFEVSRLCRIPLHTSMRASIGKCLSSLQSYYATKEDILIPWKPETIEDSKNGYELFVADRGGLVMKPLAGVHRHVGEVDFASLYPSIIRKYNISAETVNCSCCPDSKFQIEEFGMHICDRRQGIIARSLVLPLDKRFEYKRLRDSTQNEKLKKIYNERAGSLKWILVCCFGYLSYRNAKFGKIDSHIAVCSVARKTLVEAMRTAEYSGFRVVHGIVDSLWLSKRNASLSDYEELCASIEKNTDFKLAIEGIYKWIVFIPSKTYSKKLVANRYFGAFEGTNALKVRGIELRRHDAPLYFKRCQEKMLAELAKCDDEQELKECARWKCVQIFEGFAKDLEERKARATELIITRRLSKNPNEYSTQRQLSVNAAAHLSKQGLELKAGQSVSYVITSYKSSGKERSIPEEEISSEIQEYDSERYVELLADACASVLSPFGVTKEELLTRSLALTAFS